MSKNNKKACVSVEICEKWYKESWLGIRSFNKEIYWILKKVKGDKRVIKALDERKTTPWKLPTRILFKLNTAGQIIEAIK